MSADISLQEEINATSNEVQADSNGKDAEQTRMLCEEPKPTPKVIRVLTVIVYVLSVSLAAIMLSLYYTLMWTPPDMYADPSGKGIQSQRLQQASKLDMLMDVTTPDPPDTTVLASTTEFAEEPYELAPAETKGGIFLSHLFPKYTSDNNNASNETLYK